MKKMLNYYFNQITSITWYYKTSPTFIHSFNENTLSQKMYILLPSSVNFRTTQYMNLEHTSLEWSSILMGIYIFPPLKQRDCLFSSAVFLKW